MGPVGREEAEGPEEREEAEETLEEVEAVTLAEVVTDEVEVEVVEGDSEIRRAGKRSRKEPQELKPQRSTMANPFKNYIKQNRGDNFRICVALSHLGLAPISRFL